MPFEKFHEVGRTDDGARFDTPKHAAVQWHRDSDIGVGVGIGWDQQFCFVPTVIVDPRDAQGAGEKFDTLMVWLGSRRQVNDLIRVLRKARDQTFGEDA